MRLIKHGFHDYYDSVQSFGHDEKIVFNRVQSEQYLHQHCSDAYRSLYELWRSLDIPKPPRVNGQDSLVFILVVGGKAYPGLLIDGLAERYIAYSFEQVEAGYRLIEENKIKRDKKGRHNRWDPPSTLGEQRHKTKWAQLFQQVAGQDWHEAATDIKEPVFMLCRTYSEFGESRDLLVINPRLHDLMFYRIKNAAETYQDIAMFLGNLGLPENVMVQIDDKYRIAQHGFDKSSFRKRKS